MDHDGVNEHVPVDLPIDGRTRKVILHPEWNGYVYFLDRTTDEVLSATPFVRVTASHGVDLKSGRLQPNKEKIPKLGRVIRDIAPIHSGAMDREPSSYSPDIGLLYIPHETMTMDWEATEANYNAGRPYVGASSKMYADPVDPGDGSMGALTAWDPFARRPWRVKEKFPVWSGAVATAGKRSSSTAQIDWWFKALHAETGELLSQHQAGSGVIGQPTSRW